MTKMRCLSLLLCICFIFSSLSIFTSAVDIEIDLSDLFGGGSSTPDDDKDDGKEESSKDKGEGGKVTVIDKTGNTDDKKEETKEETKDDSEEESKEEEKKEEVVYNSKFSDVTEDKWYYSYVTNLASKGIVEGYPDGTFKPTNNVTRAEFVKLLVECMGYQTTARPSFDDVKDKDWFYNYISTAVENGVIIKEEYGASFNPNQVISRAEAAKLLVRATKLETGKYASPYKDTDNEFVVALYTICLMQGEIDTATGDRYFKPETGITRAETSTVFSRLLEYKADPTKFVEEKMKEYGLSELKVLMTDTQSFNSAIYGIGVSPMSFYMYELDSNQSHDDFSNSFMTAYESAFCHLPEIFTFTDINIEKFHENGETSVKVYLTSNSESFTLEDLANMYLLSVVRAKEITSVLFDGIEIENMTEIDKAKTIYTYLTSKVSYPKEGSEKDIDYTASGVFANNRGVCQGFTSAFNLLCKSVGLKCCAVSFNNHAFNCIISDGEYLFFDCTYEVTSRQFSDIKDTSSQNNNFNYFALNHEKMQNIHGKFPLPLAFWCTLE